MLTRRCSRPAERRASRARTPHRSASASTAGGPPMAKRSEVGQLAQTSYWLAQTLAHVIQLHAGLAAIEPAWRARSERINAARLSDAENRLALAIEGFGDVIRNGDCARVDRIVS